MKGGTRMAGPPPRSLGERRSDILSESLVVGFTSPRARGEVDAHNKSAIADLFFNSDLG